MTTIRTAIPLHWIEKLLEKMRDAYGEKFRDATWEFSTEELTQQWSTGLASLSDDELKRGYLAIPGRTNPPSIEEFIRVATGIDPAPIIEPPRTKSEVPSDNTARQRNRPPRSLDTKKLRDLISTDCKTKDHKRWAKNLAHRKESGDKSITAYQMQQVNIALSRIGH